MIDFFPSRASWSQIASALMEAEFANREFVVGMIGTIAEAVNAERAGVLAGAMHIQAGTVIGGITLSSRP